MRHRSCRSTMVAVALLVAPLAACGDEVTDPDAVLASAEAEAVMRSARALPSLPELLERVATVAPQDRTMVYRAQELWAAGAATDDARGAARRRLAARYAAPLLVDALTEAEWADVRARIDEWRDTAAEMLRHIAMPGVDRRLQAAGRHLERADASPSASDRSYHLLLAASELVETTPRFVARTLTAQAETVVSRAESAAGAAGAAGTGVATAGAAQRAAAPSEAALERARRLKDWAAQAVEEEEYLRAIQRAYYAIQLAEGR